MTGEFDQAISALYGALIVSNGESTRAVEMARERVWKQVELVRPSGDRKVDGTLADTIRAKVTTHFNALGPKVEFDIIKHLEQFPRPLEAALPDG